MKTVYKCKFEVENTNSTIYVPANTIQELFDLLFKEFTGEYLTNYLVSIVKTTDKYINT